MNNKVKNDRLVFADILALIIVIVCTAAAAVFFNSYYIRYNNEQTDFTDGWVMADSGETVSLSDPPEGVITLTHTIGDTDITLKRLCFKSTNTHIIALIDGKEVYSYAPELPAILGKSYGRYIHMIPLPESASEITLVLRPVYDSTSVNLAHVSIMDAGMFMGEIYRRGLPNFALCTIISLFGVLMLIIGFIIRNTAESGRLNFLSLGVFAILIGVWSANDTMILQVFTQRPEIVRFCNYICLMFIAYMPVSLMASATDHRDTVLLPVLLSLSLANFIITMVLSVLGISDIRLMLPFSHFNIALAMGMTIYLMIRAMRNKTIGRYFTHTITTGMAAAVIGSAIDLVRFFFVPDSNDGASLFTRIGVMIFIVLMGLYLMHERMRLAVEKGRAELMEKLAYTDGLTELSNRAAFHNKEDDIRRSGSSCYIVQLDINYLKKVNDVYGHAEGDRHIISAANIIRECFDGTGACFRTGGDEFIVLAAGENVGEADIALSLEKLEQRAEEYNSEQSPPVPLHIAHGFAHFPSEADMLEAVEKLADSRMYENKRRMKSETNKPAN